MKKNKTKKDKEVRVAKCKKCGKYRIFYRVDSVCFCDGTSAIYGIPVEI